MPLRHRNLVANVVQGRAWVPGLVEGEETFLLALPLFHAYGVTVGMLLGIDLAATLVLLPKPEIGLLMEAIERRLPSFVPAVPPLYDRIATEAQRRGVSITRHPLRPVRRDAVAGRARGALGGRHRRPARRGLRPHRDLPGRRRQPDDDRPAAGLDRRAVPRRRGAHRRCRRPRPGVPIGERGELLVRGPQVFTGYRGRPEETAVAFHDGWFRTGDVVTMDDAGFITIVDRIKEVIITGGFNVYPSEVEAALRGHDGILDVAVVGVPHPSGSEEVVAAVVVVDGVDLDPEQLHAHARETLTGYKVPRRFVVVEALPVNAMGKVQRREVVTLVTALQRP